MTHFNHEWDTTKTPAVPVSVGDRYYAQDLNDDFNYLKHLPYEVFLQGRSRGVMIVPNDTWDNEINSLTLSGGFGVVSQDCIELDPDEDFVIPPKTHSSPRYERIPFIDTVLILPNDNSIHYIVATPTKRSLLQRAKALFTEQYASRVKYDGVITIQDTEPTTEQILVGLCHNKEYCLLVDNNIDQCKDNIILKKWFGQNRIHEQFIPVLQSYYGTSIISIETNISIHEISNDAKGIQIGASSKTTFSNCKISIGSIVRGYGIYCQGDSGTFNNCKISIGRIVSEFYGEALVKGTFNKCDISFDKNTSTSGNDVCGISSSVFNDCNISFGTLYGTAVYSACGGIDSGTFNNCNISIYEVSNHGANCGGITDGNFNNCRITIGRLDIGGSYTIGNGNFSNCKISLGGVSNNGYGIKKGTFNICNITIGTVESGGTGIYAGTFDNCKISIGSIESGGTGITNGRSVNLNLTRVQNPQLTSQNVGQTSGRVFILNDLLIHN